MTKLPALFLSVMISIPAFSQLKKEKDIAYIQSSGSEFHKLDVYYPKDISTKKGVLIFFHGGSWKSGKKNTYRFLGKNMAKKGFVTVIANYRLSPEVKIEGMADDCRQVVKWVDQHIASYGGDPDNITASGHSAGGHLAALITLTPSPSHLPIRRTILIDAFGLDMVTYFSEYNNDYARSLREVFTSDAGKWKAVSPLYAIGAGTKTPFLVLTGGKTFKTITESNAAFCERLKENQIPFESSTIKRKKHIGMIIQFFCQRNKAYDLVTGFMAEKKNQ